MTLRLTTLTLSFVLATCVMSWAQDTGAEKAKPSAGPPPAPSEKGATQPAVGVPLPPPPPPPPAPTSGGVGETKIRGRTGAMQDRLSPEKQKKMQQLQMLRRDYHLVRRAIQESEKSLSENDDAVKQKLSVIDKQLATLRDQIQKLERSKSTVFRGADPKLDENYGKLAAIEKKIEALRAELYPRPTPTQTGRVKPTVKRSSGHAIPLGLPVKKGNGVESQSAGTAGAADAK